MPSGRVRFPRVSSASHVDMKKKKLSQKQLKGERAYLGSQSKVRPVLVGKSRQKGLEAAGHAAFTVQK